MRNIWIGKRQGNRTACSIKSSIFVDEGVTLVEAVIIDLSPTGARANLVKNVPLPEMFQILIPSRDETRYVKLRWQKEMQVGLEFIRAAEVALYKSVNTLFRRLNLLEASLSQRMALAVGETFYQDIDLDTMGNVQVSPGQTPAGENQMLPVAVVHTTLSAGDIVELAARLDRLEADMNKTLDLVHTEMADRMAANLASRFSAFEAKNTEIVQTLQKLVPLMSRYAA